MRMLKQTGVMIKQSGAARHGTGTAWARARHVLLPGVQSFAKDVVLLPGVDIAINVPFRLPVSQGHAFVMKLVLLTLVLALGATSMVKSALDSSSLPTIPPD